jgi:hypothetical protein
LIERTSSLAQKLIPASTNPCAKSCVQPANAQASRISSRRFILKLSARGSTHAWAQIYLPGTGWIDFDPTSGSAGNIGLVSVAVARDPRHAIPLHGTFIGFPSDHLGMEVQVSITSGTGGDSGRSSTPHVARQPTSGREQGKLIERIDIR